MINQMTNSHILVNDFAYAEAGSLAEAVDLLVRHGERVRVLAGGTDLLVQMKMERVAPEVVVSIGSIPGLDHIAWRGNQLEIGALATIRAVRRDPLVCAQFPALAEACASFSTTQVQCMGTIGGNLANASPASDAAPALIAYNAEAVLFGPDGERCLPVEAFFRGPGEPALGTGELLIAVRLPAPAGVYVREPWQTGVALAPEPATGAAFLKISRVAADLAKASAAVTLLRAGDCIVDCRLAFGAVAPTPRRARRAEMLLRGQQYTPELAAQAARVAAEEMAPIDDVRSAAWYRREMVEVMARDGVARAWERAGGRGDTGRRANAGAAPVRRHPCRQQLGSAASVAGEHEVRPYLPDGGERAEITLTVNGVARRLRVRSNDLLLNVLRDQLELTGTKYGCGIGECSACTVLLDGEPALACLVLAAGCDGRSVVTVEGLQAADGRLDPLQEAFLDHAAFQCGFCTPGMLMTAKSLLTENPAPGEDEVRDYLKGNLCRCTGYASIVAAVLSCARPQSAE